MEPRLLDGFYQEPISPIEMWNHHHEVPKDILGTTNAVQAWHRSYNATIGFSVFATTANSNSRGKATGLFSRLNYFQLVISELLDSYAQLRYMYRLLYIYILPVTTAHAEGCFSKMSLVKSKI